MRQCWITFSFFLNEFCITEINPCVVVHRDWSHRHSEQAFVNHKNTCLTRGSNPRHDVHTSTFGVMTNTTGLSVQLALIVVFENLLESVFIIIMTTQLNNPIDLLPLELNNRDHYITEGLGPIVVSPSLGNLGHPSKGEL